MIPSAIPGLCQLARWFPDAFGPREAQRLRTAIMAYAAQCIRDQERLVAWETGAGIAASAPCDLGPLFNSSLSKGAF